MEKRTYSQIMQTQARTNQEIDAAADAKRTGGFEAPALKRRKVNDNEEEKQTVVI